MVEYQSRHADEMGSQFLSNPKLPISLPDLPDDLFVMVLADLHAWDMVRCQKVSRAWRKAFLNHEYLRLVLKKYPKARASQDLHQVQTNIDWQVMFDPIASRYYHMSEGKARQISKYKLAPLDQYGLWYPVGQWDYHESQPGGRLYYENAATHLNRLGNKPYLFRNTLWSYDDGLVACALSHDETVDPNINHVLSILDVATGTRSSVPFCCKNKVIRNITLHNRTLVIEWAEKLPYHDLNDSEKVHRHFATSYDIISVKDKGRSSWLVTARNEWKIHFLGLPINHQDRFFSTHDGIHYAIYFWQPNRSMYTGDEDMPIEVLSVWNIASKRAYRPSTDPTGSILRSLPPDHERPHMVARYDFRALDFIGIRQHSNISLLSLSLKSETYSLIIRENVCEAGQGYFDPAERLMRATTTIVPFLGEGPAWRTEWDGDLPPYRGHCTMESDFIEDVDKWFFPVMDVYDPIADVRFSLVETCFTGQVENRLVVRIKSLGTWKSLDDSVVKQLAAMGKIAGDERWLIGQNGQMDLVVVMF